MLHLPLSGDRRWLLRSPARVRGTQIHAVAISLFGLWEMGERHLKKSRGFTDPREFNMDNGSHEVFLRGRSEKHPVVD